jgi:DNA transformation protein
MSTQASTIEYLLDQLASLPDMRARKMFGEYALYCGAKVVALVCDDTLFVKITEAGRAFTEADGRYAEGLPYRGAKPWMALDPDLLEDREWLAELVRITEEALPVPKPKRKPVRKS